MFPEQEEMLAGLAPASCHPDELRTLSSGEYACKLPPERWEHGYYKDKPTPVGAKSPTTDFGLLLKACSMRSAEPTELGEAEEVLPEDYISPPEILVTPDGTEWNNPDSETVGIFINALSTLYSQLSEKVEKNFRTYKGVMNGQLAYSEPLFYRLEKITPSTGKTIQNFFFPADLLKDGFTYIDAQVHYGVEYNYVLHGYYFVVGNEYWYEDLSLPTALEHRPRKFISGNDYFAVLATQANTTEDEFIIRNYELAEQARIGYDPNRSQQRRGELQLTAQEAYDRRIEQNATHAGIEVDEYLGLPTCWPRIRPYETFWCRVLSETIHSDRCPVCC